jgi:hypothetical protein
MARDPSLSPAVMALAGLASATLAGSKGPPYQHRGPARWSAPGLRGDQHTGMEAWRQTVSSRTRRRLLDDESVPTANPPSTLALIAGQLQCGAYGQGRLILQFASSDPPAASRNLPPSKDPKDCDLPQTSCHQGRITARFCSRTCEGPDGTHPAVAPMREHSETLTMGHNGVHLARLSMESLPQRRTVQRLQLLSSLSANRTVKVTGCAGPERARTSQQQCTVRWSEVSVIGRARPYRATTASTLVTCAAKARKPSRMTTHSEAY